MEAPLELSERTRHQETPQANRFARMHKSKFTNIKKGTTTVRRLFITHDILLDVASHRGGEEEDLSVEGAGDLGGRVPRGCLELPHIWGGTKTHRFHNPT